MESRMIISGNALARLITCSGKNHTERENYFFFAMHAYKIKGRHARSNKVVARVKHRIQVTGLKSNLLLAYSMCHTRYDHNVLSVWRFFGSLFNCSSNNREKIYKRNQLTSILTRSYSMTGDGGGFEWVVIAHNYSIFWWICTFQSVSCYLIVELTNDVTKIKQIYMTRAI